MIAYTPPGGQPFEALPDPDAALDRLCPDVGGPGPGPWPDRLFCYMLRIGAAIPLPEPVLHWVNLAATGRDASYGELLYRYLWGLGAWHAVDDQPELGRWVEFETVIGARVAGKLTALSGEVKGCCPDGEVVRWRYAPEPSPL